MMEIQLFFFTDFIYLFIFGCAGSSLLHEVFSSCSEWARGVRPRLEGKPRTLLSFRVATGTSWSPLCGLKEVKPPVKFRERTRVCSPDHAGKEGPHLAMMGASRGFPRAWAPVWDFSRGMMGISGSLSCGATEVKSPCAWRGATRHCSRVMVGE